VAHVILDENVQKSLARALRDAGHTADRAIEIGLAAAPDEDIFTHAQTVGAVVITKDTTFVDPTNLPPDHAGVILLRFPNLTPAKEITEHAMRFLSDQISLNDMRGRFVELEPGGRFRVTEVANP
jgi:predicted nuclease of predicted toxin-antitoxin system